MPSEESSSPYGSIEVRGARENNLKDVSLDIPKRRLTVFTGVSGSGKSSLVFDTIAAESQRLINETYTAFVQMFMPQVGRPEVDSLRNLSAAIVVDQQRMGANSRSTVGTATDAYTMLRIIFSRLGQPHAGGAGAFSFNLPEGMCRACEGIGRETKVDLDALIDRGKSLKEGALLFPTFAVDSWFWSIFVNSGFFDPDRKLRDYSEEEWEKLLHSGEVKIRNGKFHSTYEGLIPKMKRLYFSKDPESMAPHFRRAVERAVTYAPCPACGGTRLSQAALSSRISVGGGQGRNIAECAAMQVSDLAAFVRKIDSPGSEPIIAGLCASLDNLARVGLGYLSLDRESSTLSGGESQRVKMVRHFGSALTDLTYVFDEPSIGLHPHDVNRLGELLLLLRDKGNTVLVVEHEAEMITLADHVVDMGPNAGTDGGRIVYQGNVEGLIASGTLTGRHLGRHQSIKNSSRPAKGYLRIENANLHNLRDVTVELPVGILTVVSGVAGSGKSSLIRHVFPRQHEGVILIDQRLTSGSSRSNPATYTGILDAIRKAFAKANQVDAGLFSANSKGACPRCEGLGLVYTELAFMGSVSSVCEECAGRRFTAEVLEFKLRGKNIAEVFAMTAVEAREFFTEKATRPMIEGLVDVGLGYMTLGQALSTLSGGERQRLKLAIEMTNGRKSGRQEGQVYVLDEPTSGLHMNDVDNLISLLDRLVDDGCTVIVIEHNLDVIARADWVIDLGPGGGHDGGRVIFEGPPAGLVYAEQSVTGEYLAARVGASA